jgi:hypothetical protein
MVINGIGEHDLRKISSSAPLHSSTQREASKLEDRVRSMHLLIEHQVTVAIIGVREETSFDVIKKSVDKKRKHSYSSREY